MKNKKNLIIVSMMAIVAVMAIGYSIFATRLNINATGNITSDWNVYFSNITAGTIVGNASNKVTPSVTSTTANMEANLALPGDSITYKLTLTNGGTIGAIIEDIDAKSTGSTGIVYSISGLKVGDKLAGGASKVITIKIEYDPSVTSQPSETSKTLTVTIDAVQDIGQSITSSDPVIKGELGSFVRAILNNNNAQNDSVIDFSLPSYYVSSYKEVHAESTTSVSMSSSSTYYYGSGYTFDKSTGKYTLTGTTSGTWSTMSTNYANYPYTCQHTNTNSCTTLYKMTGYVSATEGVGYKYTREAIYNENGKGLYYTSTNTKDNKATYYFRGNVENNYVSFGTYKEGYSYTSSYSGEKVTVNAGDPIIWRIVRINEDGSIRLIKQDGVSNSVFNSFSMDNAYVGYMYGATGASTYALTHANTTNSSIKTALDTWYTKHLSSYSSLFAIDAGFCNDRSIASTANTWESDDTALGYGYNTTYYEPYNRVYKNNSPQFACPNEDNDLFTLTTSSKGNKKLTNPIGLLTIDEVVYAGGNGHTSNNNYYLVKNDFWWTMSPGRYGGGTADVWNVGANGDVDDDYVYFGIGVRPAINLSSSVEILDNGADGTIDKPYTIKVD